MSDTNPSPYRNDDSLIFRGDATVPDFRYHYTEIGDLMPIWEDRETGDKVVHHDITKIDFRGEMLRVTPRFLNSIASRFGFSPSIFTLFTPEEVFSRIREARPRTKIRLTTYKKDALAVSSPDKSVVRASDLRTVLRETTRPLLSFRYQDGVVDTSHDFPHGEDWVIGGEFFRPRFHLETPVDGYGRPSIYLSILRKWCTNEAIGMRPAFRCEVQLGNGEEADPTIPLRRVVDSYSNEEGFAGLVSRMEASMKTPASVHELDSLYKVLEEAARDLAMTPTGDRIDQCLKGHFGDMPSKYGVASIKYINPKQRRVLPTQGSVFDLLNVASELATHHRGILTNPQRLHAWFGGMVCSEFDLEGMDDISLPKPRERYLSLAIQ